MVVAALLVVAGAIGVVSQPAGAAATLEIDAGYDGNFIPGRAVPVRVRIAADRLVEGVLQVRLAIPGGESVPVSMPVEVSGGTVKMYVLSLPTVAVRGQVEVVAGLAGSQLAGEATLTFTGDTELVGLLPGVTGRVPGPTQLPADMGTALFDELDDAELATPGALDPLGTIVTGPDGLDSLDDTARRNVVGWLGAGGRLVVDAEPGAATDRVAGLPDDWQPGSATRRQAGRGEVRFSSGAAGEGRWAEVVEPTSLLLPGEVTMSSLNWVQESVADAVASDGGLRIPTLGWLAGFLVAYVVLAGPVLFVVLRLRRRSGWAWLAIPVAAGAFATGAFVVGHDVRSGSEASHGTVVRTTPAGTEVLSYVGLVSRNGADGRAEFPAGWSASGATSVLSDGFGFGRVVVAEGRRGEAELSPARVSLGPEETVGEVDLDPGGFGLVSGWGTADDVVGLSVKAEAQPDGSVTGTLRNDTDVPLQQLLVMVGERSWGESGRLAPGDEIRWEIDAASGPAGMQDGPLERPWRDTVGWTDGPDQDTVVNYPLWAEMVGRQVDPYPTGLVVAAGWTRDWVPPVDAGRGDLEVGRTAFVTEALVTPAGEGLSSDAIRREYLRRSAVVDEARFDAAAERLSREGLTLSSDVVRFTLPPTGGDSALQAKLPGSVFGVDAWDGRRWIPLQRRDWGGGLIDDAAVEDPEFNLWSHEPSVAGVPAEAVRDGTVYLRLVTADLHGPVPGRATLEPVE